MHKSRVVASPAAYMQRTTTTEVPGPCVHSPVCEPLDTRGTECTALAMCQVRLLTHLHASYMQSTYVHTWTHLNGRLENLPGLVVQDARHKPVKSPKCILS